MILLIYITYDIWFSYFISKDSFYHSLVICFDTSARNIWLQFFFPTKKRLFQNGPLIGDRSKISSSFVCLKMIKSLAKSRSKNWTKRTNYTLPETNSSPMNIWSFLLNTIKMVDFSHLAMLVSRRGKLKLRSWRSCACCSSRGSTLPRRCQQ